MVTPCPAQEQKELSVEEWKEQYYNLLDRFRNLAKEITLTDYRSKYFELQVKYRILATKYMEVGDKYCDLVDKYSELRMRNMK